MNVENMRTIHKQSFGLMDIKENMTISVPAKAELLSVGEQHGELAFWYSRSLEDGEETQITVRIVGTGSIIEDSSSDNKIYDHIGTVSFNRGTFILHVFQVKE